MFADNDVLRRTLEGQREVLLDSLRLSAAQRRALLLVNGFTRLSDLAIRLPSDSTASAVFQGLAELGLVTLEESDRYVAIPASYVDAPTASA
jgi:hypothetical protein